MMDLTGMRYGRLTVLGPDPEPYRYPSGKQIRRWRCRCDCGKELTVLQNALTGKRGTRSCGCSRADSTRQSAKDMTGQRFGRLTVIGPEELEAPLSNGQRLAWRCRCDCGTEIVATRKALLGGKLLSCGCWLRESATGRLAQATGQVDGTTLSAIRPERSANRNSKSGVKGVYWSDREKRWIAKIQVQRRQITLGRYYHLEDAVKARREAEAQYFAPLLEKYDRG